MTNAALPLLATTLTTEPILVSGVSAIRELPWLLLGLIAGAITDRVDRRRLALTTRAVNTGLIAVLAVAITLGWVSLPLIYLVSGASAACAIFIGASTMPLLPQLVPASELDRANSRLASTGGAAADIVGPPAGGALFALAAALPFDLEVILYGISTLLIRRLPSWRTPTSKSDRSITPSSIRRDVTEGLRWLAHHRQLRTVAILTAVLAITDTAWFGVLVLYVRDVLHESPRSYGLLVGAGAVGGLIGSMTAATLARRYGRARCLTTALIAAAVAQTALAVTADPIIATIALATSSFNFGLWDVITITLWQTLTPDRLLGRVRSAERTIIMTASPLGALIGGISATAWGIRAPFLLGVPPLLLAAVLAQRGLRGLGAPAATDPNASTDQAGGQ
jgi:predicted MFS family arabinose efflux permease